MFEKVLKAASMVGTYQNWHIALLDRAHVLKKQPLIYRLRNGVSLLIIAGTYDVQVVNEIWIDKIYNPRGWNIQPDWIVVDLGAHRGIFSVFAAREARMVWSIEANPEAYAMCLANLSINGVLSKAKVVNGAISNRGGMVDFYVARDAGSSTIVDRRSIDVEKKITVPGIPISSLFEEVSRVDLLKIDIEGGEYELFGNHTLKNWLPKVQRIAMEYHHVEGATIDELNLILSKEGFEVFLREERRLLYASRGKAL
jgi:FkbM family methyltransferase